MYILLFIVLCLELNKLSWNAHICFLFLSTYLSRVCWDLPSYFCETIWKPAIIWLGIAGWPGNGTRYVWTHMVSFLSEFTFFDKRIILSRKYFSFFFCYAILYYVYNNIFTFLTPREESLERIYKKNGSGVFFFF